MKLLLLTTIAFAFSATSFCQKPEWYIAKDLGGLCSKNIVLYPDAAYFFEEGCEASSQLCFGTWQLKKDTLKLQPVDPTTYAVIKNIVATTAPGDSVWVTVLDKDGVNMTAKISMGLEVAGRGSYMFSTDATGNIKVVYKRTGGKIVLRTLNKLFHQRFEWNTDSANRFTITLNVKADWISSTHADWSRVGAFRLLKKETAFISFGPAFPQRMVFKREQ